MNPQAVMLIAGLEIRQRIRSTRWRITALVLFFLISAVILGSFYLAVVVAGIGYTPWSQSLLDTAIGVVLFLGLAAAPTLSATSINGDRRDATLALVQATPVSSWDLAVGKLLGSWTASLAMIGVSLPYLVWGVFSSPASIAAGVLAVIVVAVMMLAYCAIGLGFSSLTTRPAASAMLTQAMVLLLLIGLPIGFGITYPVTARTTTVGVARNDVYMGECRVEQKEKEFYHTEYTWWMLAPNPVLIVSDVIAGGVDGARTGDAPGASGFFALLQSAARTGPDTTDQTCPRPVYGEPASHREYRNIGRSWFIGLLMTLLLGAGGLAVAARRLRVPARKLARGVRIA
ncbi:ABC transporter permease [Gordonia spumicola]|uniref:ABC transporter permease n=1 Tax=Gordonia spumicola TaxID=589161 RepID=A0A7I9VFL1_9ACTN|nr:ABC transporter permease subunit [Gordonia spumicola]GEE03903.1 ABC transporter permease [Gordonia spumicola]